MIGCRDADRFLTGDVLLTPRRAYYFALGLAVVPIAGFGWLLWLSGLSVVAGLVWCLALAIAVVLMFAASPRFHYIRLTDETITIRFLRSAETFRWEDVAGFSVATVPTEVFSSYGVCFGARSADGSSHVRMVFGRFSGLSHQALADVLETRSNRRPGWVDASGVL